MKKIKILFFLASVFSAINILQAQDTLKLKLDFTVSRISIDQKSNVFLTNSEGQVNKYDANGKFLWNYSPPKVGEVHQVEAWASMKILLFYRDFQEFVWLDRFMNETSRQSFPSDKIGFAQQICLSVDGAVWILDNLDFSLKKYQANSQQILINTPLDLILNVNDYEILFMREYQGQLFLCDKSAGILVFDNLGNYRKTLPYPAQMFLGVKGNSIYGLKTKELFRFNLYTLEEKLEVFTVPNLQFFLETGQSHWLVSPREVLIVSE